MIDTIRLSVPSKAEYISVVRLTTSSIANNMNMNIDDIEDIKVSISEACINAMENKDIIDINFNIYNDKLSIFINNVVENNLDDKKELQLGILIIKSLMDEVNFTKEGVELTKLFEDDNYGR